jgi:hypothetical protein
MGLLPPFMDRWWVEKVTMNDSTLKISSNVAGISQSPERKSQTKTKRKKKHSQ